MMSFLLAALMLGPLGGIGGDPDCGHPADDVCPGEESTHCSHTEPAGESDSRGPAHEDCPVGHSCSHPCGHCLSYVTQTPPASAGNVRAEALPPRLHHAPRSGFTVPPFRPPKPLS